MQSFLRLEKEIQAVLAAKRQHTKQRDVHLPRVSVPKIDRALLKWTRFFDLFKGMVHDTNLLTIRKMSQNHRDWRGRKGNEAYRS